MRVPEHLQSLTVAWCDGTVSQFTGDYIFTLPTFKLLAWHTEALGSLQSQLIPLPPKLGILNYHERLKTWLSSTAYNLEICHSWFFWEHLGLD